MNGADGNSVLDWMLVNVGLVIVGIGSIWVLALKLPAFERSPGDIVIEGKNVDSTSSS